MTIGIKRNPNIYSQPIAKISQPDFKCKQLISKHNWDMMSPSTTQHLVWQTTIKPPRKRPCKEYSEFKLSLLELTFKKDLPFTKSTPPDTFSDTKASLQELNSKTQSTSWRNNKKRKDGNWNKKRQLNWPFSLYKQSLVNSSRVTTLRSELYLPKTQDLES